MLLSDPRVAVVPVRDSGEPLTELDESFVSSRALVRVSVARRLALARAALPKGLGLRVIEGYRTAAAQRAVIRSYADELRVSHPAVGAAELRTTRPSGGTGATVTGTALVSEADFIAAQDTAARAVWQCGSGYQIRTRVAGSSHNSSVAPTSNAP